MEMMKKYIATFALVAAGTALFAGNPVRSGSAGASELLINPWARTAGWSEGNTANVMGLEAMYGNIAGMAFTTGLTSRVCQQPVVGRKRDSAELGFLGNALGQ